MSAQATLAVKRARTLMHDELVAQIHALEGQMAKLKAIAESAKADAELAAIASLGTVKRALDLKVLDLRTVGETALQHMKGDIESRLAEFDESVQAIASRINAR
jgi:hypothetical protein